MNLNWEPNPNAASLPSAASGDIVHLKLVNTFDYLVKAIVVSAAPEKIEASVDAIFDWRSHGQVVAAEVNELIGKAVSFPPRFLHKVIKRAAQV